MAVRRERLVRGILIAGALASVVPQAALAFYAFPSADDYCIAVPLRDGFWQAQAFWYTEWTGRYAALFVQSVAVQWDLAQAYRWFPLMTLAGTGLAIRAVVGALLFDVERRQRRAAITALVAFAVFAGGLPSTVEAFYWMPSAAAYQWGLAAFGFWTALLITLVTRPLAAAARIWRRVVLVVLAGLMPGFNEVMAPLVFAVLLGSIVFNRRSGLESHRFLLTLAVGVAALTAASFLSPGNDLRSQTYADLPTRYNLAYSLAETARQTVRFIVQYSAYPAPWLAGIAGWWWMRRSHSRHAGAASPWYMAIGLALMVSLMYLSLFPLSWVYGSINYTGEGRTYNITYVPLLIAIVITVGLVLDACARRWPSLVERISVHRGRVDLVFVGALAAVLVAAPAPRRAVRALAVAPEYLERQREREALLRDARADDTVMVDAMAIRPEGLFWGDIQPDENHWINRCVADYYCLKAVRAQLMPFQPQVAGPLVEAQPSEDALCALDLVNGQLTSQPFEMPRTDLSLVGWAYDRALPGEPAEVFAVLISGPRRYSIPAIRVARPDVAAVFEEPRFEMSGYTVQGSIMDLPPGDYRLSILQKRGAGFVSCEVPAAIAITDTVE